MIINLEHLCSNKNVESSRVFSRCEERGRENMDWNLLRWRNYIVKQTRLVIGSDEKNAADD